MNPIELFNTIYLGDRCCKSILIDGWNKQVKITIDSISRVRGHIWNYYTDEDIENGVLVFEDVNEISITPNNVMPDGVIDLTGISINENYYKFKFSVGATNNNKTTEISELIIEAKRIFIENSDGAIIDKST